MNHFPDMELVERLKKGDVSAYDTFFVKYYKLLCLNAYWFLHNEQEAKDIVQTFFLDIWDKKLYLNFNGDVKGYLHTAVKHRCLNYIKKQKVYLEKQQAFRHMQEEPFTTQVDTTPDHYKQLRTSLNDMDGQRRVAIQMVYLQGKKYQEAADEMGISINTFKTHLKNGLKLLRHAINNKDH
ncbi:RNA polymerase sigma-70 factor, ECF subfamily [Chitinophaga sp. CF118]|uniref:sigma-70 family RNA polymerase sigma factor n=1 Tax=Chitinophaga sp. CF118 TaxID=1884367 RepID=UPI0008F331AA|nr:sigma-70 family RNA polymerase sigma factor [Chitinophaga sp. CF118]SFD02280.1 RNA polymerase sigma-70 factor, ECF subfamily [Chitinophaga sp. CF118]